MPKNVTCLPRVPKNSTCAAAHSNPTRDLLSGQGRMLLTAKFILWTISCFLSKTRKFLFQIKFKLLLLTPNTNWCLHAQMKLHELIPLKNKDSGGIPECLCRCLKWWLLHKEGHPSCMRRARVHEGALCSDKSSWLPLVQWTWILVLLNNRRYQLWVLGEMKPREQRRKEFWQRKSPILNPHHK